MLPLRMRILPLNCQRAEHKGLKAFLRSILKGGRYDFVLLQEADRKVRNHLHDRHGYALIRSAHVEGTGFVILHKPSYRLQGTEFISFQRFARVKTEVGALIATFRRAGKAYAICNAHFHWGRYFSQRRKALGVIKEVMLRHKGVKVIAGDFNSILPYECLLVRRELRPQFRHAQYDAHSHDSAYLDEKYLLGVFRKLGRLGISYRSSIDHVFVAGARVGRAHVHEVLVSDHRPLDVRIRTGKF